jgi:hypothetical protein
MKSITIHGLDNVMDKLIREKAEKLKIKQATPIESSVYVGIFKNQQIAAKRPCDMRS